MCPVGPMGPVLNFYSLGFLFCSFGFRWGLILCPLGFLFYLCFWFWFYS